MIIKGDLEAVNKVEDEIQEMIFNNRMRLITPIKAYVTFE